MMPGHDQPSEQTPHLAPALTAVILGVVVLAALGAYARSLEARSIAALAADEAIIDPDGDLYRLKNQGTALQRAAFESRRLAAALRQLGAEHAPGLQSALSSDQPVPRSPHRIHGLPRGQGGDDLPDHPAKAGRGRPRAAGAESGDLPVAVLVLRRAHGLGGRLRRQFLRLARRRIGLQYPAESPAQAGRRAADAPVPGDRGGSTAPPVRAGEPGRRLPPQPRLL